MKKKNDVRLWLQVMLQTQHTAEHVPGGVTGFRQQTFVIQDTRILCNVNCFGDG